MNLPPEYEKDVFEREPMSKSCHCGCDCPQECEIHRELPEEEDETALVFNEDTGRKRFWILKHDVADIYKNTKTLEQAKEIFKKEYEKGNGAFWSDYNPKEDN